MKIMYIEFSGDNEKDRENYKRYCGEAEFKPLSPSDEVIKFVEYTAFEELQAKLLNFEGKTFSENQRIAELKAQNKKLVEALDELIGAISNVDTSNNCTKTQEALGSAESKAEKLLKELEIR